jgi:hypothetical protein
VGSSDYKEQLLTYPIASGAMCYAAENERTIYLQGDVKTGFSLCGELPGGGEASRVNLAQALLEFAMTWSAPGDPSEAQRQMQVFGGRIGQALGTHSAAAQPVNSQLARAALALEDVLLSMEAPFAFRHTNGHVCFQLPQSPLRGAAEVTSTEREVELAHHAFSALCQSTVNAVSSELQLQLPGSPDAEHTISLTASANNGR